MNSTTLNLTAAPETPPKSPGRWGELALGVAFLFTVGTAFTAALGLGLILFVGH
ncbi:hypothetical protein [Magnetospirillum sp. UT-4]|uniref:hypothetical protein n=1 Tax=Magnetospirillum sp. UT-4 TaxID=2681467 RepID=UPI001384D4FE|nr:hypothetical protein [Magnetospirillum sp. UT-4]CAA7611316.1 hypothetical protein MTBUT4_10018 [Magnetospirillum sp. UT-4]